MKISTVEETQEKYLKYLSGCCPLEHLYVGYYLVILPKGEMRYYQPSYGDAVNILDILSRKEYSREMHEIIDKDDDFIILKTEHLGVTSFIKMRFIDDEFVKTITTYFNGEWI